MKIAMKLLSSTIFGNGMSVPGGEDCAVLMDGEGFPYYKAATFKGCFREEYINLLRLQGKTQEEIKKKCAALFGVNGQARGDEKKLYFSDFTLSESVRKIVRDNVAQKEDRLNACTYLITRTAIENGIAKENSLRQYRCVKEGLTFYGEITSNASDMEETEIVDTLGMMKWIGTGRTRGMGKIKLTKVPDEKTDGNGEV